VASEPGREVDHDSVVLVLGGRGSGGGFRANAQSLSEAMIDAIDLVFDGPEGAALACAQLVIEGHTDNLGAADVNRQIGLSRALAVRQYLAERYAIPPDAMRIVSHGADRPVGDNATSEGRAANRRVVIRTAGHAH
jgi:outer membrane protein OmpA-like peptidoglycan-associated protein